jgi:hypothetical protein
MYSFREIMFLTILSLHNPYLVISQGGEGITPSLFLHVAETYPRVGGAINAVTLNMKEISIKIILLEIQFKSL